MKRMLTPLLTTVASLMMSVVVFGQQERIEVPGDNFSLEGALELFKQSSSPEEFEKLLNTQDSKVNNLDLNGDGYVDYIRVIDRNEGNVHAFIMQAMISDSESQDVAVITLERLANGKAVLQITGDEDVYGMETIIEPTQEVRINAGTTTSRTVVNVWAWPVVQYVYGPYYSVWVSPWYWSYRPFWWYRWHPVAYHVYDPWWRPYHTHYSVCYSHRIAYAYRPYRTTSVIVYNRYHNHVSHYRNVYSSGGRDRFEGRHRSDYNGRYSSNGRYAQGNTRPASYDRSGGKNWQDRNSSSSRDRYESNRMNGSSRDINKGSSTNKYNNYPVRKNESSQNGNSRYGSTQKNRYEATPRTEVTPRLNNSGNTNRYNKSFNSSTPNRGGGAPQMNSSPKQFKQGGNSGGGNRTFQSPGVNRSSSPSINRGNSGNRNSSGSYSPGSSGNRGSSGGNGRSGGEGKGNSKGRGR